MGGQVGARVEGKVEGLVGGHVTGGSVAGGHVGGRGEGRVVDGEVVGEAGVKVEGVTTGRPHEFPGKQGAIGRGYGNMAMGAPHCTGAEYFWVVNSHGITTFSSSLSHESSALDALYCNLSSG